jgi:hypothetical protein
LDDGFSRNRNRETAMSDESVAAIARELAKALLKRAHTRHPEDQRQVLALQTQLVAEVAAEIEAAGSKK